MILKTLDYRKSENQNSVYEEWTYFDNIVNASTFFDEGCKMTVVRCTFREGNIVTIAIPNVAYLMSDTGKTIEKIMAANVEELGDTEEAVYNTLQDAINAATEE
jgi:hypothetical protein